MPDTHAEPSSFTARSSLLPGNTQEAALTKLRVFALDGFLDFDSSAYGTDDSDRAKLVEVAQQQATHRHDMKFATGQTVIVGETPKDVDAGRAAGVTVVAIASGRYDVTALREAQADVVLADLTDTDTALKAIRDE